MKRESDREGDRAGGGGWTGACVGQCVKVWEKWEETAGAWRGGCRTADKGAYEAALRVTHIHTHRHRGMHTHNTAWHNPDNSWDRSDPSINSRQGKKNETQGWVKRHERAYWSTKALCCWEGFWTEAIDYGLRQTALNIWGGGLEGQKQQKYEATVWKWEDVCVSNIHHFAIFLFRAIHHILTTASHSQIMNSAYSNRTNTFMGEIKVVNKIMSNWSTF